MVEIRKRSRLAHWHAVDSPYFVTWNLFDALPENERERIQCEKQALMGELDRRKGSISPAEKWAIERMIREREQEVLNAGHGQCYLRNPKIAGLVQGALLHFDFQKYELLTWSLMPNHVHVIFILMKGASLDGVIKSWKGYTSRMANRILGRVGTFWQADYWDHSIRDREELLRTVTYVENNPVVAGLQNWPWVRTYWDRLA